MLTVASYSQDAYDDPKFNRAVDKVTGYRTKAVCCVVLKENGTVVAVVQAINKLDPNASFSIADAQAIRDLQAIAMHGLEVYRKTPVSMWKRL